MDMMEGANMIVTGTGEGDLLGVKLLKDRVESKMKPRFLAEEVNKTKENY